MFKECGIIDFHKTLRKCRLWILMNAIHCLTHEGMFAVVFGHIDEHVIELPERVIVWIAAEYVQHWLIQFTLVDFVHIVWHIHSSDTFHSYSNMWTYWMRNKSNPRPLWRRTYTSYWQTRPMATMWRLNWNEWKRSSPPHWSCPYYWTWLDWVWIEQSWTWCKDPWTCKDWLNRMNHYLVNLVWAWSNAWVISILQGNGREMINCAMWISLFFDLILMKNRNTSCPCEQQETLVDRD